jgi:hypothetical protein
MEETKKRFDGRTSTEKFPCDTQGTCIYEDDIRTKRRQTRRDCVEERPRIGLKRKSCEHGDDQWVP